MSENLQSKTMKKLIMSLVLLFTFGACSSVTGPEEPDRIEIEADYKAYPDFIPPERPKSGGTYHE